MDESGDQGSRLLLGVFSRKKDAAKVLTRSIATVLILRHFCGHGESDQARSRRAQASIRNEMKLFSSQKQEETPSETWRRSRAASMQLQVT